MMIKVLLLSVILLILAFAGFAIKMFFKPEAEFKGSQCGASGSDENGISCGCGGGSCITENPENPG